ncbi:hypothetical protein OBBRIDRAFT_708520, partial [Obba rivulosa]
KGFRILFAVWFIEANLPFTTCKSSGLTRLFRYLEVNKELLSDTTIRNTLTEMIITMHDQLIAYSSNAWSTPQMVFSFAATLAHYINNDWELVERLIDFWHLLDNEHQDV